MALTCTECVFTIFIPRMGCQSHIINTPTTINCSHFYTTKREGRLHSAAHHDEFPRILSSPPR